MIDEELEVEDESKRKSVYLITLPALRMVNTPADPRAPGVAPRTCPSTMTHEQIANLLHRAFNNPVRTSTIIEYT